MESGTMTGGTTPQPKKLGIIAFVMSIFNASEEHKVTSFFNRQIKDLNRNIKDAKQNIAVLNNQMENLDAKALDDKEDAEQNVRNVFSNLDISRLGSYSEMDSYASSDYWPSIKAAERALEVVTKDYENRKKEIQDQIDSYNKSIETYESRIKTLTEFK